MLRPSVLVVTLLLNAPSLWSALGAQTTSTEGAVVRLLVTLPIVAVLLGFLRTALRPRPVETARPEVDDHT